MQMSDTFIKPMHPGGRKFVALFAAITLILFAVEDVLGWIGLGLTVWNYYFLRDPERVKPDARGLVISPAAGVVSLIAGVFARRITSFMQEGAVLDRGEGFGSRLGIYRPSGSEPSMKIGQTMIAGETVIADLST